MVCNYATQADPMYQCLYNLNIGRPDAQFSVGILNYSKESCWTERLSGVIYDAVLTT